MQSVRRTARLIRPRRSLQLLGGHSNSEYQSSKRDFSNKARPPGFGVAFDIDGVLLKEREPIAGAPHAVKQLYENPSQPGQLRVPYIFLTNGGGMTEASRALELSEQLGVPVSPDQVLLGHTPFKKLSERFAHQLVLAVGKGEPDVVLKNYGFQQVVHMDSYVLGFDKIDPLARFKPWLQPQQRKDDALAVSYPETQVAAVFVVSDPVDWGRDLQVICDVLRSDGQPGRDTGGVQTPIYFAADDLEYHSSFAVPRFGMGAFRIALESIYHHVCFAPLIYTSFGKPQLSVFQDAEEVLKQIRDKMVHTPSPLSRELMHGLSFPPPPKTAARTLGPLKTIYMIGDNPATDIKGSKFAGEPWFSILTRTGCYSEGQPLNTLLVDKVVEDVEEAIDFILKRENLPQPGEGL